MNTLFETTLRHLKKAADQRGSIRKLAELSNTNPTTLSRWLAGDRKPDFYELSSLLDALGARILFPDAEETTREICFVDALRAPSADGAPPPDSEDYLAVPLVGEAGAGPGMIPSEEVESWVLVLRNHHSVQARSNLIAVAVGKNQTSMEPTLHPGDLVLVDRNDFGQNGIRTTGNIFLVLEPGQEGGGKIKRVALTGGRNGIITFYSDNVKFNEPEPHMLAEYDNDLRNAIVGRVVWAWSDMTAK